MTAWTFASLAASSPATLEGLVTEGRAPSFSSLVGWEFSGWNVLAPVAKPVMAALGFQRFAKGFFSREPVRDDAPFIEGYNVKTRPGGLGDPWTPLEKEGAPMRHGFYRVFPPGDGVGRLGRHPQALLLDYSLGEPANGLLDGRGLRDFVVAVTDDLLVGKAYFHLGPLTVVGGYFVAARLRPAALTPARAA